MGAIETIRVRISKADADLIREAAKDKAVPISTFIRMVSVEAAREIIGKSHVSRTKVGACSENPKNGGPSK
jgi:uncharacterized protein (DUF1778 family)